MSECGLKNIWNLLEGGNDKWRGSARQWHNTESERQVWLSHPSQGLTWEDWVTLKLESRNILNYIRNFWNLTNKGEMCYFEADGYKKHFHIWQYWKRKKKSTKNLKQQNTRIKQKRKYWNWPARKSQYVNMYTQIPVGSQLLSHPKW